MPWRHVGGQIGSQVRQWQSEQRARDAEANGDHELAEWHREESRAHSSAGWQHFLNLLLHLWSGGGK